MLWNVVPYNRKLITIKTAITTFNQHLFSLLGRDFRKQDDRNWFRRDQGRGRGRGGPMMYEIQNSYFYFTFYGWRLRFTKGSTMYFVNYSYWQHPTVTVVSFFLTKSQLLLIGLKPCSHFFTLFSMQDYQVCIQTWCSPLCYLLFHCYCVLIQSTLCLVYWHW